MPETPSEKREGDQKFPKKGGKLDKYKWYIIGGLALMAALVFFFVNKSNSNAAQNAANSTNPAGTPPGIDPNTGIPYSQEMGEYGIGGYGGFGGGGGQGPAGPAGPRGKQGKQGKPGKQGPPGPKPESALRKWLIKQTGSQHPYTWLHTHNEHVTGSGSHRRIVHNK